jgi:hypothetical protein
VERHAGKAGFTPQRSCIAELPAERSCSAITTLSPSTTVATPARIGRANNKGANARKVSKVTPQASKSEGSSAPSKREIHRPEAWLDWVWRILTSAAVAVGGLA